jgi:hypothetical protein
LVRRAAGTEQEQWMRKLIEAILVSLDGVVGSAEEWALPYWDEENKAQARQEITALQAIWPSRTRPAA